MSMKKTFFAVALLFAAGATSKMYSSEPTDSEYDYDYDYEQLFTEDEESEALSSTDYSATSSDTDNTTYDETMYDFSSDEDALIERPAVFSAQAKNSIDYDLFHAVLERHPYINSDRISNAVHAVITGYEIQGGELPDLDSLILEVEESLDEAGY